MSVLCRIMVHDTISVKGATMSIYVYLAAPYTDPDPVENTHRAVVACNRLREMGYTPFCPHLMMLWHFICPQPYRYWLDYDIEWLAKCDVLLRLPGRSNGADEEEVAAGRLGIPMVFSVEQLAEMFPLGFVHNGTCGDIETDNAEHAAKDNKSVTLPNVAIVGHARSGKDCVAKWLENHTALGYAMSTSEFYWSWVIGQPLHLLKAAKAVPARRMELADEIEKYNATGAGTRLYRELVDDGHHLVVGIRRWDELRRCLEQGVVSEVLWVAADVPPDPTQGFSQRNLEEYGVGHAVVENDFTPALFDKLRTWCELRGIEVGE